MSARKAIYAALKFYREIRKDAKQLRTQPRVIKILSNFCRATRDPRAAIDDLHVHDTASRNLGLGKDYFHQVRLLKTFSNFYVFLVPFIASQIKPTF